MKKELLTEFLKEMLTIEHIEKGYFKHTHKGIMATLVSSCQKKYIVEWNDTDIIRDEVYYCLWRALNVIAAEYTDEELIKILRDYQKGLSTLEVNKFLARVKSYAALDIKKYLINRTKTTSQGEYINSITIATDVFEFENLFKDCSVLQKKSESHNHFTKWFLENRKSLLTNKQNQYIEGINVKAEADLTEKDKNNQRISAWRMRQRISKRVLDKYNEQFPANNTEPETLAKIQLIESILEGDLVLGVCANQECDVIIDAIYDYVPIECIKKFNKATRTQTPVAADVVKKYRVALFKTLRQLYDKADQESTKMTTK